MTDNCKRVHFIGVGGVGMSGIARVAADAGMRVSGSDMKSSRYTDDLVAAGIPIFIGHDAKHVTDDIDAVVISTAIPETNPELARARELGISKSAVFQNHVLLCLHKIQSLALTYNIG